MIHYPPHINYSQIAVDTSALFINNLKAALLAVGWSNSASSQAVVHVTFSGIPANGNTLTIDGTVFTFKTTPVNPTDVQIGGSAAATATNLQAVIHSNGGTGGNYDATLSSSTDVKIVYITAGSAGNGKAISMSGSGFTLTASQLWGGGETLLSAKTSQGLSCALILDDDGTPAMMRYRFASSDLSVVSVSMYAGVAISRVQEVRATDYDVYSWLLSDSASKNTVVMGGVPWIRDVNAAPVVASVASNGGAIQITVATPLAIATGAYVFIDGSQGLIFNGSWQVTRIDDSTYILIGSTYAGGYVANSAIAANETIHIGRAIWSMSGNNIPETFRNTCAPQCPSGGTGNGFFGIFNQYSWYSVSGAYVQLDIPQGFGPDNIDNTFKPRPLWGNAFDTNEARICWPVVAESGTIYCVGELWAAVAKADGDVMDTVVTAIDGHDWINITDKNSTRSNSQIARAKYASLWLAKA